MVNMEKIDHLLDTYFHIDGDYEIMPDGSVEVAGDVSLIKKPPKGIIPVEFAYVEGYFSAPEMGLVSLLNAPSICEHLQVFKNKITSLTHCPQRLHALDVSNNNLTNLVHGPTQVDKLLVSANPLTSLEGLPEKGFEIELYWTPQLPLLRLVYAEKVHVGKLGLGYAHLKPFEPVNSIMSKYTGKGKPGALKAAAELIKAGFKDNARW